MVGKLPKGHHTVNPNEGGRSMSLPNLLSNDRGDFSLPAAVSRRAANRSARSGLGGTAAMGAQASFIPLNPAIEQLQQSNRELQAQVARLSEQLAQAKAFERQEILEKERLAQRLSTLLSILPAGVVVLDGQGRIQQCNPAAIELLGEPLEGERWGEVIQRCFAPRADDGHEISLKDGRRVSISTRSMESEPGQLVLLHDMTETRALQAQVSRNERLSAMGRMVASLAHQVRTPLSAAMLYGGHLSNPDLSPELRVKCAEKLMSRLVHLDQQVRDMLIFARGETRLAEKMRVGELIAQFQNAAEAGLSRAGAQCQWQVETTEAEVLCNKEALVGVLLNLLHNSLEASSGTPRLKVTVAHVQPASVQIEIADQGVGFSPEDQARMMEAFYTTKAQGTGLGLAVVQAVVKAHHGSFSLQSEGVGRGARARITLPLFTSEAASRA